MLTTEEQLEKLNNFHKALEEKGFLDENLKREMETWKQILINSLEMNDFLNKRKEFYKSENEKRGVKVLQLMTEKNGLDEKILNYKSREQELNRQITNLKGQVDNQTKKTKELTELNETLGKKYQTDTQKLNSAIKKLKAEKARLNH